MNQESTESLARLIHFATGYTPFAHNIENKYYVAIRVPVLLEKVLSIMYKIGYANGYYKYQVHISKECVGVELYDYGYIIYFSEFEVEKDWKY